MNFGARVPYGPVTPSPRLILYKLLKGICSVGANFYQKFEIFAILSYFSPHISVPIMLKFCLRERTWEFTTDTKFRHNCSRDIHQTCASRKYNKLEINIHHLRGNAIPAGDHGLPVLHCLGGDVYCCIFCYHMFDEINLYYITSPSVAEVTKQNALMIGDQEIKEINYCSYYLISLTHSLVDLPR